MITKQFLGNSAGDHSGRPQSASPPEPTPPPLTHATPRDTRAPVDFAAGHVRDTAAPATFSIEVLLALQRCACSWLRALRLARCVYAYGAYAAI